VWINSILYGISFALLISSFTSSMLRFEYRKPNLYAGQKPHLFQQQFLVNLPPYHLPEATGQAQKSGKIAVFVLALSKFYTFTKFMPRKNHHNTFLRGITLLLTL